MDKVKKLRADALVEKALEKTIDGYVKPEEKLVRKRNSMAPQVSKKNKSDVRQKPASGANDSFDECLDS